MRGEISQLRRTIHASPELGEEELLTSRLVRDYLRDAGIETQSSAGTGVIGLLRGVSPGKTVGLRADMDALPIQELNQVDYASMIPGKMHACGHDVHTASLLAAARLLARRRGSLHGNVKFFFEPNEEKEGGALRMISGGGLDNPTVSAIFGAHVNPDIDAGKIGLMYGKSYAAADTFDVVIHGKGSHGAEPHRGIDSIAIGAQIISALQQFVGRQVDPLDAAVVTIGSFHGGTRGNIVAPEASFSGIVRTLDPATRSRAGERIPAIIRGVAVGLGAEVSIAFREGYPCLVNDQAMTDFVRRTVSGLLGEENCIVLPRPTLGTEDFSFFLERIPGCFYQVGARGGADRTWYPLHSERFDVDEGCLPVAAAVSAGLAFEFLRE